MNAAEAAFKVQVLNKRIEALNHAYGVLWDNFDDRMYAVALESLRNELALERDALQEKLRSVQL